MCEIHIVPLDDLRDHEPEPDCWCRPEEDVEEPGVWLHNAMDQRELYETGQRKLQ